MTLTKRQARILMGACAWSLYVWISRLVIMSGQDESTGFKVVHAILAAVSIGFGVAVGKIGWQARKADPGAPGGKSESKREKASIR